MCVLVNVYRDSSATFEKVKSYQLPLFSIQGIYNSDYSQLSRKRLILRSIGGPEPALRHSGERDKGKTHHAEAGGASWGIVGRLRGLFTRSAAGFGWFPRRISGKGTDRRPSDRNSEIGLHSGSMSALVCYQQMTA
jgi:hypothetical protein